MTTLAPDPAVTEWAAVIAFTRACHARLGALTCTRPAHADRGHTFAASDAPQTHDTEGTQD